MSEGLVRAQVDDPVEEIENVIEEEGDDAEEATFDFDEGFQEKIIALTALDTNFAMRAKGLLKPEYFSTTSAASLVSLIVKHVEKYRAAPGFKLLAMLVKEAINDKRIRKDEASDVVEAIRRLKSVDLSNGEFVLDRISDFARRQAVEQAMIASIAALQKGDFATIEKI